MELDLIPIGQFEWLDSLVFFTVEKNQFVYLKDSSQRYHILFSKMIISVKLKPRSRINNYASRIPKEFKIVSNV